MPTPPHPNQAQLRQTPAHHPSAREGRAPQGCRQRETLGSQSCEQPLTAPTCSEAQRLSPLKWQCPDHIPAVPKPTLTSSPKLQDHVCSCLLGSSIETATRPYIPQVLPHSLTLVLHPQPTTPEADTRQVHCLRPICLERPHRSWPSVNSAAVPHGHAPGLPVTLLGSLLPQWSVSSEG